MAAGLPGAVAALKSAVEGLMLSLGDGGLKGDPRERALKTVTKWIRKLTDASHPR